MARKKPTKKDAFTGDFVYLQREMEQAARAVDEFPEDQEFTAEQLDFFDSLRHSAIKLTMRIEALFECFNGKTHA